MREGLWGQRTKDLRGRRPPALRVIAGLGAVEHTGPATDTLGRTGSAVTFTDTAHQSTDSTELIFAPNGTLLSIRYSGIKNYYVAFVSNGWTNDQPRVPSPTVP